MTFDIIHGIDIDATPARLYEALTTQRGLAAWWTPQTQAEPKVGVIDEFRFGTLTTLKFRVSALEPNRRVSWVSVQVPPDWKDTTVTFDVYRGEDSAASLRFRHAGFRSTEGSYGMTSYSWAQYMRSIKLLLETGQGEPFGSRPSISAGTTPS